jgi:hypothetical protein
MASRIADRMKSEVSLGKVLEDVWHGLDHRSAVRRPVEDAQFADTTLSGRATQGFTSDQRAQRLALLLERSKSREDAIAVAVGTELWMLGIQMILTTATDQKSAIVATEPIV